MPAGIGAEEQKIEQPVLQRRAAALDRVGRVERIDAQQQQRQHLPSQIPPATSDQKHGQAASAGPRSPARRHDPMIDQRRQRRNSPACRRPAPSGRRPVSTLRTWLRVLRSWLSMNSSYSTSLPLAGAAGRVRQSRPALGTVAGNRHSSALCSPVSHEANQSSRSASLQLV